MSAPRVQPRVRNAWEVEDGEGVHGIHDPRTPAEVGASLIDLYGADMLRELLEDSTDPDDLGDFDLTDPEDVGRLLWDTVSVWHVPTRWMGTDIWPDRLAERSWDARPGSGRTRIVWVTL